MLDILHRIDDIATMGALTFQNPWLVRFFQCITQLGSAVGIIVISLMILGYLFIQKRRLDLTAFLWTVISGEILNELLKWSIHRKRPPFPWLTEAHGYSFPSGHTLLSTVTYGFIIYLIFQSSLSKKNRSWALFLIVIPVFVGISRVYLGVHFGTDVLAGWLIGLLWVNFCIKWSQKRKTNQPYGHQVAKPNPFREID